VDVPAFSIGKYKVTNGEYLEFVRQGAPPPFFWHRARANGAIAACSRMPNCRSMRRSM
jgi:formylglycine-generating enzyme required for sulfatase activity